MDYDFEKLAVNFSRRFLKAGDVLFREGDTNGDGYIVEVGKLELIRNEGDTKERTAVLGEGEVLGVWKILFANDARYFTAKATIKNDYNCHSRTIPPVNARPSRPISFALFSEMARSI